VTPTYELRVWQEGGWWLARVIAASDGADPSPLNALTQARSLAKIGQMGRNLVATILDDDGDDVSVALCARDRGHAVVTTDAGDLRAIDPSLLVITP
jgi:hypothetical protein